MQTNKLIISTLICLLLVSRNYCMEQIHGTGPDQYDHIALIIQPEEQESSQKDDPEESEKEAPKTKQNIALTVGSAAVALGCNQFLPNSAPSIFAYGTFGVSLKVLLQDVSPWIKIPATLAGIGAGYALDNYVLPKIGINNAGTFPLMLMAGMASTKRMIKIMSKNKKNKDIADD